MCKRNLLKTLWKKEKLLVMSNFSFSYSVFYPFGELSTIFIKPEFVVCKFFQFGRVHNLLLAHPSMECSVSCCDHFLSVRPSVRPYVRPSVRPSVHNLLVNNLASTNINQSLPNLATIHMSMRVRRSSIMGQIEAEHWELFALEFGKIAAFDFVYTLASTNIDQSVPNLATIYIPIKSQMSVIIG